MTTAEQRAIANAHRSALEAVIAERERQLAEEAEAARQRETKEQALRRQAARDLYHEHLAKERLRIEKLSAAELKREAERVFAEPKPAELKFAKTWTPPPSPEPVPPTVQPAEATEREPLTRLQRVSAEFEDGLERGLHPSKAMQSALEASAEPDYELEEDTPPKPVVLGAKLKKLLGLTNE